MPIFLCARGGLPCPLRDLERLGVGVEIQDFVLPQILEYPDGRLSLYERQLEAATVQRSLHGAVLDLRPASLDPRILDVTRLRYHQSLDVCHRLGANLLVLHSQVNPFLMASFGDKIIARQADFWQSFIGCAEQVGVTILLENVFDDVPDHLVTLLDRVDSSSLGICIDVGHVIAFSTVPIEVWIERLAPHLRYLHVHETERGEDQHRPPSDELLERIVSCVEGNGVSPIYALEYEYNDKAEEEVERLQSVVARAL